LDVGAVLGFVLMVRQTPAALICSGAQALREAGIEAPRLEARLLLARALGVTSAELLRNRDIELDPGGYDRLLARRAAREPLALILGRREFWSLDLEVSPATIVPRPETETLIEAALTAYPERNRVRSVLDLGTGTGCLLLAALTEFDQAFGVGVDISAEAAALAAHNATRLGLRDRAAMVCGDWAASIRGPFDLVLSNPPYIPTYEISGLMPEVARHEPRTALDGGLDGFACYRLILASLPGLLAPAGVAVLELGEGQAEGLAALARKAGFRAATKADLAGRPRAMTLRRAGT
jgi:release factor glutamine methyltransferase